MSLVQDARQDGHIRDFYVTAIGLLRSSMRVARIAPNAIDRASATVGCCFERVEKSSGLSSQTLHSLYAVTDEFRTR